MLLKLNTKTNKSIVYLITCTKKTIPVLSLLAANFSFSAKQNKQFGKFASQPLRER